MGNINNGLYQGDIVYVNFGTSDALKCSYRKSKLTPGSFSHEQQGERPAVVLNACSLYGNMYLVAPITTREKPEGSHTSPFFTNYHQHGYVMMGQMRVVDSNRIDHLDDYESGKMIPDQLDEKTLDWCLDELDEIITGDHTAL